MKRSLLLLLLIACGQWCIAQLSLFNPETNTYEGEINHVSMQRSFQPTAASSVDIRCEAGKFWSVSGNGDILEWKLNGGTITSMGTLFSSSNVTSLGYCSLLDTGSIPSTLYGDGGPQYYSGTSWVNTNATMSSIINCGGHGRFLYYMTAGNTKIVRYNGVSITTIFTMPFGTVFGAADLAVDAGGNIWTLTGKMYNSIDSLVIIDSIGKRVHSYALNPVLNSNNFYGSFLMDSTLFIGIGAAHPNNPNTILPITVSAGKALQGTPIPFGNYYDLASCYSLSGISPVAHFISSDSSFCNESGTCIDFFDQSTNNPINWKWSFPGAVPDTSTQQNPTGICYTTPGTYSVKLIVSNTNGTDSLMVSPMITFAASAAPPILTFSGDTIFCSHAATYQWYLNGLVIPFATDSFYVITGDGVYAVLITDGNDCSRLSNGFPVAVNSITGMGGWNVYPNPVKDLLIIDNKQLRIDNEVLLRIYNVLGEMALQSEIVPAPTHSRNHKSEIDVRGLAEGMYILEIGIADKIYRSKFVKE